MATNKESSESDPEDNLVDLESSKNRMELLGLEYYEHFAQTKEDEEATMEVIRRAAHNGDKILNLSSRGLLQLPPVLLRLPQLECLYLERNKLTSLPDSLFRKLINLSWLDLRWNCLKKLPVKGLGNHRKLSHLLLGHNQLRSIPADFGLVATLVHLQTTGNPLEYPSQEVLQQGERAMLQFLRQTAHSRRFGGSSLTGVQEMGNARPSTTMSLMRERPRTGAPTLCKRSPLPPIGSSQSSCLPHPPLTPPPLMRPRPRRHRPCVPHPARRSARVDKGEQVNFDEDCRNRDPSGE